MNNEELNAQLAIITESTSSLLHVIDELKDLATVRLENIETELRTSTRTLQQSIMFLAELASPEQRDEGSST